MNFLKSVLLGICVSVVAYFALFSLALVAVTMLPAIKFISIGLGCAAMIYFMRKEDQKEESDVQDPK